MNNKSEFKVKDIFFLGDGKIVFAGHYIIGSKNSGKYTLYEEKREITKVSIEGRMIFPSKITNDIAIYTFDAIKKNDIDISKSIMLKEC